MQDLVFYGARYGYPLRRMHVYTEVGSRLNRHWWSSDLKTENSVTTKRSKERYDTLLRKTSSFCRGICIFCSKIIESFGAKNVKILHLVNFLKIIILQLPKNYFVFEKCFWHPYWIFAVAKEWNFSDQRMLRHCIFENHNLYGPKW